MLRMFFLNEDHLKCDKIKGDLCKVVFLFATKFYSSNKIIDASFVCLQSLHCGLDKIVNTLNDTSIKKTFSAEYDTPIVVSQRYGVPQFLEFH